VWTVRARTLDLRLTDHIRFTQLSLVERYNQPDTAVLQGTLPDLAPLLAPGMGAVLYDGPTLRTSGVVTDLERHGDGTAQATIAGDLIHLWDRICYPNPAQAFGSQTSDYDVRTGARETLLLAYVNANAGPGALTARQAPRIRMPGNQARGGTVTVRARFDKLGELAATLAEASGLRLRVLYSPAMTTGQGWLDVRVEDAPDLTAWARYGTPTSGGPGLLAPDWQYSLSVPTVTRAEVAAGGLGAARILREEDDADAEALWGRRIEALVDQRQTTDAAEIAQAGQDAVTEGVGQTSVQVKLLDSRGVEVGSTVPVGARVTATLDGLVVKERVREVTTTVAVQSGAATVTVEPVFGTSDTATKSANQVQLAKALRRISVLERAN
jgi:hypothetical protein